MVGPRSSGKSTLMAAFVDLIDRTRSDHVITLESDQGGTREPERRWSASARCAVTNDDLLGLRAALRENPRRAGHRGPARAEVVVEELEAAAPGTSSSAGCRALGDDGARADSRSGAAQRRCGTGDARRVAARRRRAGAAAQDGGGRVAARDVLNTPRRRDTDCRREDGLSWPLAMESGRRHGMVPLTDALVAFVQKRRRGRPKPSARPRPAGAPEAAGREGIDTSFVERLA